MSAIDFRTSVARKPDPKGDRVVITLDGKVSPGFASSCSRDGYAFEADWAAIGIRSRCPVLALLIHS
jgi:hypothetical protein